MIGSNIANSQTTGYKSRQADYASLLFQQIDNSSGSASSEGRLTPDGIRVGAGAKLGGINIDLTLGSLRVTDRPLDVALLQDNYLFQVEVTDGDVTETYYTRDGSFYLNPINNTTSMLTKKNG